MSTPSEERVDVSMDLQIRAMTAIAATLGAHAMAVVQQTPVRVPILINRPATPVLVVTVAETRPIRALHVRTDDSHGVLHSLRLVKGMQTRLDGDEDVLDEKCPDGGNVVLRLADPLPGGEEHPLTVIATVRPDADIRQTLSVRLMGVETADGTLRPVTEETTPWTWRLGVSVVDEDEVKGGRIPGITTTPEGTLLAIFDARYENVRDLQGHMDIGLKRSTDGGQTWSDMQPILDRGEWGGLPEAYNGVSDACILVDTTTGTVFVAGCWMHGVKDSHGTWVGAEGWNHQWRRGGSGPGLGVKETCQFLITRSTDDGLTWSTPTNLTRRLKHPDWHLFAPAPGRGITMSDGTLVMPVQGRDETGTGFSTIMTSSDRGRTWTVGTRALTDVRTTEGQVVELTDGALMLNMRSDYSRRTAPDAVGRAVCVTRDLGATWSEHATSGQALPEPGCCAGLLAHASPRVLVFSNPPNRRNAGNRTRMTLKISRDEGMSWPRRHFLLLDEQRSAYSCLTSVDHDTIGILYEGSQTRICFMAIALNTLELED